METARARRNRQAAFALSTMAVAGVLIWAKLRLVTNIPRSVYAVPDDRAEGVDPAGADGEADAGAGDEGEQE